MNAEAQIIIVTQQAPYGQFSPAEWVLDRTDGRLHDGADRKVVWTQSSSTRCGRYDAVGDVEARTSSTSCDPAPGFEEWTGGAARLGEARDVASLASPGFQVSFLAFRAPNRSRLSLLVEAQIPR